MLHRNLRLSSDMINLTMIHSICKPTIVLITTFLSLLTWQQAFCNRVASPALLKCEHLVNPLGVDNLNPRLSWAMDDSRNGARQSAWSVSVGTDSVSLLNGGAGVWKTAKTSTEESMVLYKGQSLLPFTKYFWKVDLWDGAGKITSSAVASFEMGMVSSSRWQGTWISDNQSIDYKPAPYFRKTFDMKKKVLSARAYIAAGGMYELYLNGRKVGNHRLDPMYTRYDRRNLYVTYDVTGYLQDNTNAIGVLLGNGWYNHQSTAVWDFHKAPWRARPAFCLDLRITYQDGSVETITSDKSWKTGTGSLIFNSIYTAEHHDSRLEQPGWNTAAFDDSSWKNVINRSAPSKNIVSQQLHPIRDVAEIPAQSMQKINDTVYVFNLGRNISGVSKLTVQGDAGTIIRLRHAERLYSNGRVDLSNIDLHYRPTDDTDPFQTDIYILNGKREETFIPKFNYKGFQYVEVTSSKPVQLTTKSLSGYFMHSDVPNVGNITSSNPVLDKIWEATNNSYLSNLFGYPTDCPQREKNGWTGDAHIAIETGLYSYDAFTIYEKWLADHRDEQQPNGVLPSIIPTGGWGYEWGNGPDWTSTIAIIPWNLYLFYGDQKPLADNYDHIKRYVDHINYRFPAGLTDWGLGDWVPVKSVSPVELTSTAYYFTDVTILAKAAKILGKQSDYLHYSALALKIKNAFNAKYLDLRTGIYGKGLQTELSVPLAMGLTPNDIKSKVAAALVKRVEADNFHLDAGILGTKAILNALSENGYADVAYKIAAQETYPSWGWWIVNGATTLLENWNIEAKNDISLNHIMFGEIGAWLYKGLGGIKPDPLQPGFKNVLLKPHFVNGLDHFTATHQSRFGTISSAWKKTGNRITYTVTIPANATGSISFPVDPARSVYLNGKSISNPDSYLAQSGTYVFEIR